MGPTGTLGYSDALFRKRTADTNEQRHQDTDTRTGAASRAFLQTAGKETTAEEALIFVLGLRGARWADSF